MRARLDVAVIDSVTAVEPAEWDALVGGDVTASHGWLRTVESTFAVPLTPSHAVVRIDGRLVGAAAAYLAPRGCDVENLDQLLFGRLRGAAARLGVSLHPALLCGPVFGYGGHLLYAADADAGLRRDVSAALVDALERAAAQAGARPAFAKVLAGEHDLLEALAARGYVAARGVPLNVLDVAWRSFEGYLRFVATVSRGARGDIRRQINRNVKQGTVIERLRDAGPVADRLHELAEGNSRRHNGRGFPYRPEFFPQLCANLGDGAVLRVARKGDEITAVQLTLVRGDTAVLPLVAVDHERAGNDFTYFNIGYYTPIAEAISAGIRHMLFGRALYDLKARRGCRVVDVFTLLRAPGPERLLLRPWAGIVGAWNRVRLPRRVRRARVAEPVAAAGPPGVRPG